MESECIVCGDDDKELQLGPDWIGAFITRSLRLQPRSRAGTRRGLTDTSASLTEVSTSGRSEWRSSLFSVSTARRREQAFSAPRFCSSFTKLAPLLATTTKGTDRVTRTLLNQQAQHTMSRGEEGEGGLGDQENIRESFFSLNMGSRVTKLTHPATEIVWGEQRVYGKRQ